VPFEWRFAYPMRSPIRPKRCVFALAVSLIGVTLPLGAADAIVDPAGGGQFKTVQEAINAAPQNATATHPWIIRIKPGSYRETVYVQREKRFVHLAGDDAATTKITYDLYASLPGPDGKPLGTFRTPTMLIDADDFTVENLTLENAAGPKGQALALRVDGDRVIFRHCRFLGFQDTILVNRGRHYFEDCYVTGAVDFIFGAATDWFERGEIHCVRDGYITAASTPVEQPHGFVFSHMKISGEPGVKIYLGRPWRPYARTIFLHCDMSETVRPEGWHNWNKPDAEQTSFYGEFESSGSGGSPGARVPWSHQLSTEQAAKLTVQSVLGGADDWNPTTTTGRNK
jgi:pectinesterase